MRVSVRGLCPGGVSSRGSLPRRVSVRGLCPGGISSRGSLSGGSLSRGFLSEGCLSRGSLSRRVSVRGLCPGGISSRGSLSGRVSVKEESLSGRNLFQGVSVRGVSVQGFLFICIQISGTKKATSHKTIT